MHCKGFVHQVSCSLMKHYFSGIAASHAASFLFAACLAAFHELLPSWQDLKSKNVLLAKDYTAKLADMGLFGQSPDRQGQMIRDEYLAIAGTVEWTAPEASARHTAA